MAPISHFCILLLLLLVSSSLAERVQYCMPPISSYMQSVKSASHATELKTNAYSLKTQFDMKQKKQRIDTITNGNIIKTQIDLYSNNQFYAYSIQEKNCSCVNSYFTFLQCMEIKVMGKNNIGQQPAVQLGSDASTLLMTRDESYWVVPAQESGFWWFVSHVSYGYTTESRFNKVDGGLETTSYYGHTTSVDVNAIENSKLLSSNERLYKAFQLKIH